MPILENFRHEAFAVARAGGAPLEDAYEDAGFASDSGNASRLARRADVAARIAELRGENADLFDTGLVATIGALMRIAREPAMLENPAALREARTTLLEAYRLRSSVAVERRIERRKEMYFNEVELDADPAGAVEDLSNACQ